MKKPAAIISPQSAPLRTMMVTMTVMCYLACLAIGALILINQAVDGWTRGLSREVTVQLRQISSVNIEAELQKTLALLNSTNGVTSAEALDPQVGMKLLEPWLGNLNLGDLPVPRLVRVTIDEAAPPDFEALAKTLSDNIKGASLDTHRRWQTELARMAHSLSLLSILILVLICTSAVAMVVFAARAVLAANREVVEVLHLVGAKNAFIARQIDRRFLTTGLLAGCGGVLMGAVSFLLLGFSGQGEDNGLAAASFNLIYPLGGYSLWTCAAALAVPIVATLIALFTARLTLMNMLRTIR